MVISLRDSTIFPLPLLALGRPNTVRPQPSASKNSSPKGLRESLVSLDEKTSSRRPAAAGGSLTTS